MSNIIEEFPDMFMKWMLEYKQKQGVSPAAIGAHSTQDECAPGPEVSDE